MWVESISVPSLGDRPLRSIRTTMRPGGRAPVDARSIRLSREARRHAHDPLDAAAPQVGSQFGSDPPAPVTRTIATLAGVMSP